MSDPASLPSLPPHLQERCRRLNGAESCGGAFVLYWMHHAMRAHENPALDVAVVTGNALGLPVLVYQGLGGRHRYDSDRHYTFILEGAREAHAELAARGVRAVFHLDPRKDSASPLPSLLARCALAVFEDYPAPPMRAWSERLADRATVPVVAVDCACVLPMRLQPCRFDRAHAFRRHNAAAYARRVPAAWPPVDPAVAMFDGDVGFAPLDLATVEIGEVCACCRIDHAVAPVAHTPGGSTAGYARWRRFRDVGLRDYADARNDAALDWPRGVSRLSAYLHHGMVSPLRIAREAHATGGRGAGKFLDELLIWRELAYNFCFHTPDPERLDALPAWARETLASHADDPRPVVFDDETLARSHTGDAVWDLAQTSLRVHGELHNNLRMTWAKALLDWRPDPQRALDTLVELNHRYALDASDPSSYGGLLWAMGLFDRPFEERAVTGTLRRRSTQAHARRLDLERVAQRLRRPAAPGVARVAIVGAGLAGLAAARTLQDHGLEVTVFDKSRGVGGRLATRRAAGLTFDHGAQYFTVRDDGFRRLVTSWCERGLVEPWDCRIGVVEDGRLREAGPERERFVAVPGMNALAKHLAADLDVVRDTGIAGLEREGQRWALRDLAGGRVDAFDRVIVATPAPQAVALLTGASEALAAVAGRVSYAPAWAVMLVPCVPLTVAHDAIRFGDGPLAWAARDGAKPGRRGEAWVLHATPGWSRSNTDAPKPEVIAALVAAFFAGLGVDAVALVHADAHRWLYARVEDPLGVGALWDPDTGIGACGDWCADARVEDAFLSGQALAGRMLGTPAG